MSALTTVINDVDLGGQPSSCKECRSLIRWVFTNSGKRMALDFRSSKYGTFIVTGYLGGTPVVSKVPRGADVGRLGSKPRFRCHFDTCKKNYRKADTEDKAPKRRTHTARFLESNAA